LAFLSALANSLLLVTSQLAADLLAGFSAALPGALMIGLPTGLSAGFAEVATAARERGRAVAFGADPAGDLVARLGVGFALALAADAVVMVAAAPGVVVSESPCVAVSGTGL
jgi:hypothetical protein